MALMETIMADMKLAMKNREKLQLETLRTIRAALMEKEVERRPAGAVTPDDEISVLNSALKKRREASEIYRQHGRADLADQEDKESEIIRRYLPQQLSSSEVEQQVKNVIGIVGAQSAKDVGKVMSVLMKDLKGKADGKLIQETVKKLLGA